MTTLDHLGSSNSLELVLTWKPSTNQSKGSVTIPNLLMPAFFTLAITSMTNPYGTSLSALNNTSFSLRFSRSF